MAPPSGLLAAAVGPGWDTYYRRRFGAITGGDAIHWNWAAALVPFWGAWRKLPHSTAMYVAQFFAVVLVAARIRVSGADADPALAILLVYAISGVAQGMLGARWVYSSACQAARNASERFADTGEAVRHLAGRAPRRAPSSDLAHAGVSVLLLLIALYGASMGGTAKRSEERAQVGALRADLKELWGAQDAYFERHGRFAESAQELGITPRAGVSTTLLEVTSQGWMAEGRHAALRGTVCVVFHGTVSHAPRGVSAAEVTCQ